jgi:hypothetical protein
LIAGRDAAYSDNVSLVPVTEALHGRGIVHLRGTAASSCTECFAAADRMIALR